MLKAIRAVLQIATGLLVAFGVIAFIFFMLETRAKQVMTASTLESGALALKSLCEAAGSGFQQSMSVNRIAARSMQYWLPDVDLMNIPAKEQDEYRIVLIGGLGNQLTDHPRPRSFELPKLIEQAVSISAALGNRPIRVLNFSAYGTNTYQNYLAMNLADNFGQNLKPDLIVAHVGFNDWVIPFHFEQLPEVHCGYTRHVAAPMYATRPFLFPPSLQWADWLFPNIMERTPIGSFKKNIYDPDFFIQAGREGYKRHRGIQWSDIREMMNDRAIPFFISAMKSIKRDQRGVPILVMWQGATQEEIDAFGAPERVLEKGFYKNMYTRAKSELTNYVDNGWAFVNVNDVAASESRPISADPNQDMQRFIARIVASEIIAGIEKKGMAQ